jgi:hypothetical protein
MDNSWTSKTEELLQYWIQKTKKDNKLS